MPGVSYARLRGFPKLFATYCADWDRLAAFFPWDWRREESYRTLARRIQSSTPTSLADALARQNEGWGNAVGAQIDALQSPGALAVVTGQQVGLFGGPLYTLYKALTAVKLAERLSGILQRPVVPVFWLEGGDHDLAEVSTLNLLGSGTTESLTYQGHAPARRGNLGSVGPLVLRSDIDRVREELRQGLPNTEFRSKVLDDFCSAYQVGTTFTDAFARTMAAFLSGSPLVLMDPEDSEIKKLVAPLFERALLEHGDAYARLESTTQILRNDYHVQVQPRSTSLFYQDEFGRNALRPNGADFTYRSNGQAMSASEAVDRIRTQAYRFSPNVALRPLVQDSLLPTVAYVAGPGEVSYFAQFKSLYEWAGIPMPIIYPRASITILESREQRVMRKHGLELLDLLESVEVLLDRILVQGSRVDAAFVRAAAELARVAADLSPAVTAVDATLGRTADATRAAWVKELEKLRRRVIRAEKRKHDTLQMQLARSRQAVFPSGKLQERVLPAVYYLSKYGPKFLATLNDNLSLQTARHQTLLL